MILEDETARWVGLDVCVLDKKAMFITTTKKIKSTVIAYNSNKESLKNVE